MQAYSQKALEYLKAKDLVVINEPFLALKQISILHYVDYKANGSHWNLGHFHVPMPSYQYKH